MNSVLAAPATHATPHPLHGDDRIWQETNCYADLWIELLHARGLDPVPALAAALASGFDGEQWTFVKPQPGDLFTTYAATVDEVNVWRPLVEHVVGHLDRGRSVTVEVDSFWLPDTAATTYRNQHAKTTIAVTACDPATRGLTYLHGAGSWQLSGADFDGAMRTAPDASGLPPYMETISWGEPPVDLPGLAYDTARLAAARRPVGNQAQGLAYRVRQDLAELALTGVEHFHAYAFGTARQCGASLLLSSDVCSWLAARGHPELGAAAQLHEDAAQAARTLQFQLARVAAGRRTSVEDALEPLVAAVGAADTALDAAGLIRSAC